MANIKFSQFTQKTTLGTVDFLVGYTGAQNIQVDPVDLLSDYPTGSGATGRVAFWEPSNNLSSDYLFKWDNSNNRLGLGVEIPTATLHVVTADDTIAKFVSSDNKAAISISDDDTTGYFSAENGRIGFGTGLGASSSNISILTSNSNVGIGTVSPSAKLEVDGTFISTGISQLGSGGSNVLLTSSSAGNVGVGISSPESKLHVGPSALLSGYTTTATTLAISDVTNGAELILRGQSPRIFFDSTSSGNAEMYLDGYQFDILSGRPDAPGSSRFYINASGNVGIATSNPQTKFHVNGGQALFASDTAVNPIIPFGIEVYRNTGGNSNVLIHQDDGNHESVLHMRCGGNDTKIKTGPNTWALKIDTETLTDAIALMSTSGNLGIGTTSPSEKLSVAGNIIATSSGNTALSVVSTGGYSQLITQASNSDSAYVFFKDTSGERARVYSSTSNDLIFKTNGGSTTALTLDNSGDATFAGEVALNTKLTFNYGGNHYLQSGTNSLAYKNSSGTSVVRFDANTLDTVFSGDVEIANSSDGIILESPDGTRYRVTVANGGTLSVSAV